MCYCSLTYDDNLIFVMFYIKMACIIFSCQLLISDLLLLLSQFFEAVKELHKVQFPNINQQQHLKLHNYHCLKSQTPKDGAISRVSRSW